jgi:hypothetical protein
MGTAPTPRVENLPATRVSRTECVEDLVHKQARVTDVKGVHLHASAQSCINGLQRPRKLMRGT